MKFEIKKSCFMLDGKKVFLNSGEIHYFRIKKQDWDMHLRAAKEAGLMAVSSYIPWAWHEQSEGVFDFDGSSCQECDLKGWLSKCKEHGLYAIVKPGPFILAEYRGAGLPEWFLEKNLPSCSMQNSTGEVINSDGVTLFDSVYLEKVTLWYDRIMPLLKEYELDNGGPVIMMQICNEIGVFSWLAKHADYSEECRERFISFISEYYKDIENLNTEWNENYSDFVDVELPPDGNTSYSSKEDRARDNIWHKFWRRYYGDYIRLLSEMARERGITVPFYHNLPGWIYGNGYEFPVNITMYDDLYGGKDSDILFGVDHIPEFMSYRNMHDDRIINDIVLAMQGNRPLFAAEFQCGSREYHVVTNPREMELFYKASIANGLVGWNYYMFSQGSNPSRKGYSGDTFYWFNPLTKDGERTTAYPLVKRINKLVKTAEDIIVNAERKAEVCVIFYSAHYATEIERPMGEKCDIHFTPSEIRRSAYFDGLLKVLQILNIDYDMADLSKSTPDSLKSYKQVWALSTDEMDTEEQGVLANYAENGGNLVLFPYLPDRDLAQKPCTVLRDALSVAPAGFEEIASPLVDILGYKDIKCSNPQVIFNEEDLTDTEIIARNISGSVCGIEKSVGDGKIMVIGTSLGYDTEGVEPVYEAILQRSKAQLRKTAASHHNLSVRERFTDDNKAILFAGNYYNETFDGGITYTHPVTDEKISLPYNKGEMVWPSLYALLTPVNLPLNSELSLLHSTSDILGIEVKENQINLTIHGDRDMPGEIVIEGAGVANIADISIDSEELKLEKDQKRLWVNYLHKHEEKSIMKIRLNCNY